MKNKILLAFATMQEAAHTIEELSFRPTKETGVYENQNLNLVITGIGPYAAHHSIESLIDGFDEIWNIGIAGSLSKTIQPNEIHEIGKVSKFSFHPGGLEDTAFYHSECILKEIEINQSKIKLITADFPLHNPTLRDSLSCSHHLIDMEGYAIAHLCKTRQKKCRMIKLASDMCDKNTSSAIKRNLHKYSKSLFNFVSKSLELKELK